ncbi:MAG: N-6 DNA methylase [Halobacteriota archaeon]
MDKNVQKAAFQTYLRNIRKSFSKGDYTEMTLRTPLENLISGLDLKCDLTHEPRRMPKLGAPDFKVSKGGALVGYIEAKDLGKNLDNELVSEQIKKYRESIPNIILTDYTRFILLRDAQVIFDVSLLTKADLANPKSSVSDTKIKSFQQLFDSFLGYNVPTITSARVLAEELSKRTKLLKDLAKEQLDADLQRLDKSSIYEFSTALSELIKDISEDDCADAYAQTITYGLFLARFHHHGPLERDVAYRYIPRSIKVIRRIFSEIAGDYLPANVSWIVDELVNILNASDIEAILTEITDSSRGMKDPFYIFYEDFLALYEPEKRKHRGVYYTPTPVVNFIVRSVNEILKTEFSKHNGLSDEDVTILDPAVGTGAFLSSACVTVLDDLRQRGLKGLIPKKIEKHFLKNFYGFEILVTPYIVAHLKLSLILEYYYKFKDEDRLQIYLTNTLDPFEKHGEMPFFRELTEESIIADEVKILKPILVILGNPPYSGSSSIKSEWVLGKMQDYKRGLNEKNIQPLDDDYLKFIRFAQWKIDRAGEGVVAFITNNRYLDGYIHRQARKSLIDSFNRIFILNLHGSARRDPQS